MKKRMRTLICLALVIMLVASMAVPAMATSHTGTNTTGSITYNWSVTCGETTGTASISISPSISSCRAIATNYLYDELNNLSGTTYQDKASFASVTATAGNILDKEIAGVIYHFPNCNIEKTSGTFYIASSLVVSEAFDTPG